MLKELDYVDPSLATKIHTLQQQLKKMQLSKKEIMNNSSILPKTKEKLLRYQDQCQQNTRKLLAGEKDKLADYLDQQTNVVTKNNRENQFRYSHKQSVGLNQSTRIDLTDDNKSFEVTGHTENYRKVTSFYVPERNEEKLKENKKYGNSSKVTIRRLKKRVNQQQNLIKMLVTWVKIYNEREVNYQNVDQGHLLEENQVLSERNRILQERCESLQGELTNIKNEYKEASVSILQTHRKYQKLRDVNSELQLERKQLLKAARSLGKDQGIQDDSSSLMKARK